MNIEIKDVVYNCMANSIFDSDIKEVTIAINDIEHTIPLNDRDLRKYMLKRYSNILNYIEDDVLEWIANDIEEKNDSEERMNDPYGYFGVSINYFV